LSDGGIVGLDMAIHHPERVRKLGVTGANFRTDAYVEGFLNWLVTVKPDDWPPESCKMYERLSPDGPSHWPVVLERLQRMWAVEPEYTLEQMANINAPTLVIVGDRDLITLEHSVEMFRVIPDAQLAVLPNAGHGVVPEETILTFFSEPLASA
jgi:pimeloyl-ACP methyl ester carboxylesterase